VPRSPDEKVPETVEKLSLSSALHRTANVRNAHHWYTLPVVVYSWRLPLPSVFIVNSLRTSDTFGATETPIIMLVETLRWNRYNNQKKTFTNICFNEHVCSSMHQPVVRHQSTSGEGRGMGSGGGGGSRGLRFHPSSSLEETMRGACVGDFLWAYHKYLGQERVVDYTWPQIKIMIWSAIWDPWLIWD
jgi:hypothetical protein